MTDEEGGHDLPDRGVLHAGAGQIGLLSVLSTVAFLVIGLPAGPWVDRVRRRPVMIATDLARAVLVGSVPVAWGLGLLTIYQMYGVALGVGIATVFFDVATQSHLPSLVGPDRLISANSAFVGMNAVNDIAGRGAGAYLIHLAGAPVAVVVDALSYLWSALCITRIRRVEPEPAMSESPNLRAELAEGIGFVLRHPLLRPMALGGVITNLGIILVVTMLPLVHARDPRMLGLFYAVGGAGILIGASLARRIGERVGNGRALWLVSIAMAPSGLVVPFVGDEGWVWLAAAGWAVTMFKVGIDNVIKVSFRQAVTPHEMLGRMSAIFRFLFTGVLSVGAGLAGLLGELIDLRAPIWAGVIALGFAWLPAYLSPLRTMRDLPKDAFA